MVTPARDPVSMADIVAARHTPGATLVVMLTDRCPVGCAHCSVDSRPDSPIITDRALLDEVISGVCADANRWLVGITGGEPFVERWGLPHAVARLRDAGKRVAVVTSGNWGTATVPLWIHDVLRQIDTVILSTDVFHVDGLTDERFVGAARAAADSGCWVVVQHLDDIESTDRARALATAAFGAHTEARAELFPISLMPMGRARDLVPVAMGRPGRSFGRCTVLEAPVVRYDGTIVPCCNEEVTMGAGPAALRQRASSAAAIADELERIRVDPLLETIRHAGFGVITELGAFADLADRHFAGICDLCFAVHDRVTADPAARRQVEAVAVAMRAMADPGRSPS
jgi:hypothetical protein